MHTDSELALFDTRFHNPSIFALRSEMRPVRELIDFCVPANSYFPPAALLQSIQASLPDILKYYPDYAPVHQDNISRLTGTPAGNIVAANGVTEIITMLCAASATPILTDIPTFGRWTDLPVQFGADVRYVERRKEREFRLSVDEIVERTTETGARTMVMCNPNNPTGAWLSTAEIAEMMERLRHLSLIVIDESFIDFSGMESAERLAVESPNTMVVKSMGKALGWHGIRLGYGVGNLDMVDALRSKVPYWNINGLAAFVLKQCPTYKTEYVESFKKVAQDREYMLGRLRSVNGLRTYPSRTNFLMSEVPDGISGKAVRNALLKDHGLFVRECSNKIGSTENYLRFVVRKPAEIDTLTESLADVLSRLAR